MYILPGGRKKSCHDFLPQPPFERFFRSQIGKYDCRDERNLVLLPLSKLVGPRPRDENNEDEIDKGPFPTILFTYTLGGSPYDAPSNTDSFCKFPFSYWLEKIEDASTTTPFSNPEEFFHCSSLRIRKDDRNHDHSSVFFWRGFASCREESSAVSFVRS